MTSFISTTSITAALRQSVLTLQSELSNASTEVSTGDYADIGLTLGSQTGQSVSLQSQNALLQTITTSNSVAGSRLSTTQTVLSSLQSAAQDMLNSLIESSGSSSGASTTASTAQTDLQTLTSGLNTTQDGSYIFAGTNTATAPITDYFGTSAANKSAVDSAFASAFGFSQSSSSVSSITGSQMQSFLSGSFGSLFQGSSWSSDWSSASDTPLTTQISTQTTVNTSVSANQAPFQQLAQAYTMLGELGNANLSSDAYQAVSTQAQSLLTSAISGLTDLQSSVGSVQSSVTSANTTMSLQMNILTTQVSNLESVNPYDAATRVSDLQTQIETAYSLTSQLHNLSLVNYLPVG
jgi:flagellar hook-associated protein 3 FlgL